MYVQIIVTLKCIPFDPLVSAWVLIGISFDPSRFDSVTPTLVEINNLAVSEPIKLIIMFHSQLGKQNHYIIVDQLTDKHNGHIYVFVYIYRNFNVHHCTPMQWASYNCVLCNST